jgi:hypothetical protein
VYLGFLLLGSWCLSIESCVGWDWQYVSEGGLEDLPLRGVDLCADFVEAGSLFHLVVADEGSLVCWLGDADR